MDPALRALSKTKLTSGNACFNLHCLSCFSFLLYNLVTHFLPHSLGWNIPHYCDKAMQGSVGQLFNTEGQEKGRSQILLKQRLFKELRKLYWKFKLVQCTGHHISAFTKCCGGLLQNKFKHEHCMPYPILNLFFSYKHIILINNLTETGNAIPEAWKGKVVSLQ